MKIVDCFIFYNELELLIFRLNELNDYVDYFVLVESRFTHSGKRKELYYEKNIHMFSEYSHKIIHIIDDYLPDDKSISGFKDVDNDSIQILSVFKKTPARIREEYQRNSISKGLNLLNLNDDDIVIISDADEIINPDIILEYKDKNFEMLALEQEFYFYNLNYKYPKIWTFPKVVKYRVIKEMTPEDIRLSTNGIRVKNGGWHFTYFFGIQNIIDKIKSFSHQEFNTDFYTNEKYIEDCIKNGKYIFDDVKLEYIEIDNNKNLPRNYNLLLSEVKTSNKHCFLITSYCDTDQKVEILNECIDNLKKVSSNDICLHAHYPLNDDLQKKVNYYIYDSSNPVLKYPEKYITWWRTCFEFTLNIYKDDYGYAVLQQWKRGFDFLKNLYDNVIIINYDVIITKKLLSRIENKSNFDGCNFLHENSNTITPLLSIKTKSNVFDKISIEQYKFVNGFAENFAEYIYRNSDCYRFNFNEYKDDYYTMLDFEGSTKFKENKLSQHYSPYNILNFVDFDIFLGERENILNILFYNINSELEVKIYYNDIIFDQKIIPNYLLINTGIVYSNFISSKLNIIVNDNELKINIFEYCKII